MKVRIKGNSLRLRLLRSEVAGFGKNGRVTETIRFGNSSLETLTYSIEADSEAQTISARFADNQIVVVVPKKTAQNWVDSDLITLESSQPVNGERKNGEDLIYESPDVLRILIEKDFVCLDRKDDPDNADAFPHPTGKCV